MDLSFIIAIAAIGALGGLFAGMLGIGGGIIMTPLLIIVFESLDYSSNIVVVAITTSLVALLFTSIPSAIVHSIHRSVSFKTLVLLVPFTIISASIFAQIASLVSPIIVVFVLILFLISSCYQTIKKGNNVSKSAKFKLQPWYVMLTGSCAGAVGAFTGTGGGIVVTPMLKRKGVPLIICIGTSAVNIVFLSLSALFSFGIKELNSDVILILAPACIIFSIIGAQFANKAKNRKLQIIYAGLLILIILRLIYWIWIQLLSI